MTRPERTDHAASWYAASANPHPSHPPLAGAHEADVCVVGAGFSGLSAALHLLERGYSVVVLECARVGWGASGRNGGQVGSGQRRDVLELEPMVGRETTRLLWDMAEEAKRIIQERIARHAIRCDYRPGNLLACTKPRYMPELERETEHLARHYDYHQCRMLTREQVREQVASEQYCGGRLDSGGGHLHPLNYALGLADAVLALGGRIFEQSHVTGIGWGTPATVRTTAGEVRAGNVLLCGNGYLGRLEPRIESRVMPIDNHVVATAPLGEQRARSLIRDECCVHATKFVVDYYRTTADHRLLFGGGETYSEAGPADIGAFVRRYMLKVFPQLADVAIDYAWSGRLAITMNRLPSFGRLGANGYFVQGFSGHGVAMTQLAGRLLAEAVAGSTERFDVFARLPSPRFPGGRLLRKPALVAGMLWYALRDRL